MSEKTNTKANRYVPKTLGRFLGGSAVADSMDTADKVQVAPNSYRKGQSLDDFLDANIRKLGLTKDAGVRKLTTNLKDTFRNTVLNQGRSFDGTPKTGYGHDAKTPAAVFKWNLDEISEDASKKLIAVMDARQIDDPTIIINDQVTVTSANYVSSTGLVFTDRKSVGAPGQPSFHDLLVHYPAQEIQEVN